jgi:diketogulonate reductase-like aldo/keto reductase
MLTALATKSPVAGTNGDSSNSEGRKVRFRDGTTVPAIGQGSWHLAQGRHPEAVEEDALQIGLSLGLRLIDTAELYGETVPKAIIGA